MKNTIKNPTKKQIEQVLDLEVEAIPSFPPVMTKLLEICSSDSAGSHDLSKLVATDPGISARVMGVVGSAIHGRREKIKDVAEAVKYLGIDAVKRLALGAAVFETIIKPEKKKNFDRIIFWRHCLCVATLSQIIANQSGYQNPDEAYSAGLLHDFGKIVFDLQGRVNYDDFVNGLERNNGPMILEERDLMGMGHDDLGGYFCAQWHLPEPLLHTVIYHHRPFVETGLTRHREHLIAVVCLANFLAWTQGMGSFDVIRPPVLQPGIRRVIDTARIDFKHAIADMDREMENTSRFYRFVFPSAGQFRENLLKANLDLCQVNTLYFYGNSRMQAPIDLTNFKESLSTPHRSLEPDKIIANTLKAIKKEFAFDRIYIMRIIKSSRLLRVAGILNENSLKSLEIPIMSDSGRIVRCLRKRTPVLIDGKRPSDRIVLDKLGAEEIAVVPVCSKEKVIGILGMDNKISNIPIRQDVISAIAVVAGELGMALENARIYKEAQAVSRRDGLTGLYNRIAINELLAESFRNAVNGKNTLSVVMIDVDYFKKFNDNFGHQTGDNVLKLIATTMKKLSRPFDHVGRYGGEEFVVVLNHTDLAKAVAYAQRIRREVEKLGLLLKKRFPGLKLTISAGVSQYRTGIKNPDALIALADKAMYQAKNAGRNKVMSV